MVDYTHPENLPKEHSNHSKEYVAETFFTKNRVRCDEISKNHRQYLKTVRQVFAHLIRLISNDKAINQLYQHSTQFVNNAAY